MMVVSVQNTKIAKISQILSPHSHFLTTIIAQSPPAPSPHHMPPTPKAREPRQPWLSAAGLSGFSVGLIGVSAARWVIGQIGLIGLIRLITVRALSGLSPLSGLSHRGCSPLSGLSPLSSKYSVLISRFSFLTPPRGRGGLRAPGQWGWGGWREGSRGGRRQRCGRGLRRSQGALRQ